MAMLKVASMRQRLSLRLLQFVSFFTLVFSGQDSNIITVLAFSESSSEISTSKSGLGTCSCACCATETAEGSSFSDYDATNSEIELSCSNAVFAQPSRPSKTQFLATEVSIMQRACAADQCVDIIGEVDYANFCVNRCEPKHPILGEMCQERPAKHRHQKTMIHFATKSKSKSTNLKDTNLIRKSQSSVQVGSGAEGGSDAAGALQKLQTKVEEGLEKTKKVKDLALQQFDTLAENSASIVDGLKNTDLMKETKVTTALGEVENSALKTGDAVEVLNNIKTKLATQAASLAKDLGPAAVIEQTAVDMKEAYKEGLVAGKKLKTEMIEAGVEARKAVIENFATMKTEAIARADELVKSADLFSKFASNLRNQSAMKLKEGSGLAAAAGHETAASVEKIQTSEQLKTRADEYQLKATDYYTQAQDLQAQIVNSDADGAKAAYGEEYVHNPEAAPPRAPLVSLT